MPRLPRLSTSQLLRALERMGFQEVRQVGSHRTLYHQERDVAVTVPAHARKTLHPKPLRSILKQGGIGVEELRQHL